MVWRLLKAKQRKDARQHRSNIVVEEFGNSGSKKTLIEQTHSEFGITEKLVKMSEKKAIKVIKKNERARKPKAAPKGNTTAQSAREMVQTVTNWVNELQQKRRSETANAVKLLMPNNPRASEA